MDNYKALMDAAKLVAAAKSKVMWLDGPGVVSPAWQMLRRVEIRLNKQAVECFDLLRGAA